MLPVTASEQERLGSLEGVVAFQICFFLSAAENKFLFSVVDNSNNRNSKVMKTIIKDKNLKCQIFECIHLNHLSYF